LITFGAGGVAKIKAIKAKLMLADLMKLEAKAKLSRFESLLLVIFITAILITFAVLCSSNEI